MNKLQNPSSESHSPCMSNIAICGVISSTLRKLLVSNYLNFSTSILHSTIIYTGAQMNEIS